MISLVMAQELQRAGLAWEPRKGDRFALPDRDMDDRVFVINDMPAFIERIHGIEVMTFHGTPEWALDYVYMGEVVWLPEEGQLRNLLQERLLEEGADVYDLIYADGVYTCRFARQDEALAFSADDAADAYAQALLHLLRSRT